MNETDMLWGTHNQLYDIGYRQCREMYYSQRMDNTCLWEFRQSFPESQSLKVGNSFPPGI
jgi:hypothetical protein